MFSGGVPQRAQPDLQTAVTLVLRSRRVAIPLAYEHSFTYSKTPFGGPS